MSTRGARHFTILSRRGKSSPGAEILVNRVTSLGATVRSVRCDVSVSEDVDRAVEEASAKRPVRGIVYTAVSYEVFILLFYSFFFFFVGPNFRAVSHLRLLKC